MLFLIVQIRKQKKKVKDKPGTVNSKQKKNSTELKSGGVKYR